VFCNHQDAQRFIDENPKNVGAEQVPWGLPDNQLAVAVERAGAEGVEWVFEFPPGRYVAFPGLNETRQDPEPSDHHR
jgi:hypothetical protein